MSDQPRLFEPPSAEGVLLREYRVARLRELGQRWHDQEGLSAADLDELATLAERVAHDHTRLVASVREMRDLQRRYFRTRDRETMRASMEAERAVDALVGEAR